MTISIVTFAGNTGGSGGGLYNDAAGAGSLLNTTFDLNTSPTGSGGAVFNSGKLNFTNATISKNSAVSGGGIYTSLGSSLLTVNATIAVNSATPGGHGGGLDVAGGTVTLYNTIVAGNVNGVKADDIYPLAAGTISSASSYNLIGTGAGNVLSNGVNGNLVNVSSPDLGSLANNGGPLETIALLAGSPAIDAGSGDIPGVVLPSYDERGAERGPGGINAGPRPDIGAYEASSSYLVTTAVDAVGYGSIISAVEWANISFNDNPANLANPAPNTVTFDSTQLFSAPQVITVTAPLVFSNTTTPEAILGTGISALTLSGGDTSQIIKVSTGTSLTLTGVTLYDGSSATGGAVDNFGTLNLGGVELQGDTATNQGGAVRNESLAHLSISNSTLVQDSASSGGAIYNSGNATITSSTISDDSSSQGGAIENAGTLVVQGTTLSSDSATSGSGGALGNSATGNVSVVQSTFSGDEATGAGAQGGAIGSAGLLSIAQSIFTGNSAGEAGGAVDHSFAATPLSITDTTFKTNSAPSGGAIFTAAGTSLDGATFTENSATSGGAVDVGSAGSLTGTNATVTANTASSGAGVYSQGTLQLVNATIAYNQAADAGGGLDIGGGTATLYNTLVAENIAGAVSLQIPSDIAGSVNAASSYNLVASATSSGGLSSGSNGNLVGIAAGIAAGLANNGGPTETIALLAGSPAIDAGSDSITGVQVPAIDQRGAERGPAGLNAGASPDIGAYEASSSYLVSSNLDTSATGTLRTAVGWANINTNANPANIADPAPNTVEFDTTGMITLSAGPLALANAIGGLGSTISESIQGPGPGAISISGDSAGGVFSVAFGVTASISGLTVTGGLVTTSGGAIDNAGALTLSNLAVTGNTADLGGGVMNEPSGTLTVSNSTFSNNVATNYGGAIANGNTLTLSNDTFTLNSATSGAAIANIAGSLTVNESTISSNTATGSGGGIDNDGTATITSTSVANNTAGVSGGGVAQSSTDPLTLTNTTIAFNSAADGGGLWTPGPVTLIYATVADNSVPTGSDPGGGISLATGGMAGLYDSIVAQNTVGTGGGSAASDISVVDGGSLVPNSSYNLIGKGGSGGLANGGEGKNQVGVANPGLEATLASNGGITQTLALLSGSPAIDAGSATIVGVPLPAVDQRGAVRGPEGLNAGANPDLGAFEDSSSYLVSSNADTSDIGTIASAVAWANVNTNINPANLANPAPNTIVFDQTGVFANPQTITLTGGPLSLSNTTTAEAIDGPVTGAVTLSGSGTTGALSIASGVTASITGLTISGATSTGNGGAIDNFGDLSLSNDTLSNNTAAMGGAVENTTSGTLSVYDTTLSSNTATTSGGALANAGVATLTNTTIALNTAPSGGGIDNTGTLTLINDTVAYNTATSPGGGAGLLAESAGTATLFNSIVALNTDTGGTADDISNSVSSSSADNVIDDSSSAGGLSDSNGNQVGLSAGLRTGLADNGGPTATIAILAGSPAIDAGAAVIPGYSVPTTDQRGALRNPTGSTAATPIDVGAYEISSSYLVSSTGDSLLAGTLRSAVEWADNNPASSGAATDTILFDPTVFGTAQTIDLSSTLGTLALTNTIVPVDIVGPGAAIVNIQGNGGFGLFSIAPGVSVTASGLTLSDGGGQTGGAIDNQGTLTISNSVFSGNAAVLYGGAIYNQAGTLNVSDSTFTNNTAIYGLGGAIDNSGTLTVTSSTFTGGDAFEGGAIDNKDGTLTLSNSTLNNNTAIQGGDIYNNASATITGSTLSNSNAFQGGGIANDLIATLTLLNSTIANNSAGQNGGGINQVGILTALSSTIAYNSVAPGGAGGGIRCLLRNHRALQHLDRRQYDRHGLDCHDQRPLRHRESPRARTT